jgi:hypothetical protein
MDAIFTACILVLIGLVFVFSGISFCIFIGALFFVESKPREGKTKYRIVGPSWDSYIEYEHDDVLFGCIKIPGSHWSKVPRVYYNPIVGRSDIHCSDSDLYVRGDDRFLEDFAKQNPEITVYLQDYEKRLAVEREKVLAEHARSVANRNRVKNL